MTYARTVNWLAVHEFVQRMNPCESWPMAGSVEWQQLSDEDPRKMAAIYDAAQHWALRVDTAQEARAEASRAVSSAVDWTAVARDVGRRDSPAYIPREKATA